MSACKSLLEIAAVAALPRNDTIEDIYGIF